MTKACLPMNYENYVFDLYGTLVDIHTNEKSAAAWRKMALFYGYYGAHYAPNEMQRRYRALTKTQDPFVEIDIVRVFEALFLEKDVNAEQTLSVHAGQFFRALTTKYVRLYQGTADMLASLRGAGKRVYLLSNAQRIFTAYEMDFLGLTPYFNDVFLSSDHGFKKPDARFFRALMEKYAFAPDETLFIGNDSVCDVSGARQVGMHTFYVHSNLSPAGDAAPEADDVVEEFEGWE